MLGLDTNVVIRYLVQDDLEQSKAASELIESLTETVPAYVSLVTLVEVYWVLRRSYTVSRAAAASAISGLLDSRELVVDRSEVVRKALQTVRAGADLADAIILELGRRAGCEHTVTFDQGAVTATGMRLLTASA